MTYPQKLLLHRLILIAITAFILAFAITTWLSCKRDIKPVPNELLTIQSNSLLPVSYLPGQEGQVLASLVEDKPGDRLEREIKTYHLLLAKILDCEGKWKVDACNTCKGTKWEGLYPPENCACGRGIGQLTKNTIEKCSEDFGRKINPFNKQDNLECSLHIFLTEGSHHWGCKECDWGSCNCWGIK